MKTIIALLILLTTQAFADPLPEDDDITELFRAQLQQSREIGELRFKVEALSKEVATLKQGGLPIQHIQAIEMPRSSGSGWGGSQENKSTPTAPEHVCSKPYCAKCDAGGVRGH